MSGLNEYYSDFWAIKMNTIKLLLFLGFLIPSIVMAHPSSRHYGGAPTVIVHMGHKFYYHPTSQIIYAKYYDRRTINALADLCYRRGLTRYHWIPNGYYGAIPHSLHRYTYQRFYSHGIRIYHYQPRHERYRDHHRGYYNHERQGGFSFYFRF